MFRKIGVISVAIFIAVTVAIPSFAGECYQQKELQDLRAYADKLEKYHAALDREYENQSRRYHSDNEYVRLMREEVERAKEDLRLANERIMQLEQQLAGAAPPAGEFIPGPQVQTAPRSYFYRDPNYDGYVRADGWNGPAPLDWNPIVLGAILPPFIAVVPFGRDNMVEENNIIVINDQVDRSRIFQTAKNRSRCGGQRDRDNRQAHPSGFRDGDQGSGRYEGHNSQRPHSPGSNIVPMNGGNWLRRGDQSQRPMASAPTTRPFKPQYASQPRMGRQPQPIPAPRMQSRPMSAIAPASMARPPQRFQQQQYPARPTMPSAAGSQNNAA